jgi:acetyltransferase-like isoleucine patch superfamily enzyme
MTVLGHDWYPAEVPANVVLGERSWLYSSFAFIHHHSEREPSVRIGPDSGIYRGSYFELGPAAEVEVGRACTVAGATFSSNDRIVVGDYTLISDGVVIADSFAALPPDARRSPPGGADRGSRREVRIGDDVWIGTRAVILGGARIGNGAIVGAGAVVEGEVPEFAIAAGNPARVVGWARPRAEGGSAAP